MSRSKKYISLDDVYPRILTQKMFTQCRVGLASREEDSLSHQINYVEQNIDRGRRLATTNILWSGEYLLTGFIFTADRLVLHG